MESQEYIQVLGNFYETKWKKYFSIIKLQHQEVIIEQEYKNTSYKKEHNQSHNVSINNKLRQEN